MKKYLFVLIAALFMVACSSGSEEVETKEESAKPRESEDVEEEEYEEVFEEDFEEEEDEGETLIDEKEMLIDEEKYSVELLKVEKGFIDEDEFIKVHFNINNKSDDYLEFYSGTASADGKMINDMYYDMFIEVSPGKEAEDTFNIYKFEEDTDFELPELKEDLEIEFNVNDEEWEFEDNQTVTITF